jgi:hypothetical protein
MINAKTLIQVEILGEKFTLTKEEAESLYSALGDSLGKYSQSLRNDRLPPRFGDFWQQRPFTDYPTITCKDKTI